VLSQSKAAILTAVVCASVVGLWRWILVTRGGAPGRSGRGELTVFAGLSFLASAALAGVWVLLSDPSVLGGLARQLDARAVADLGTGTGRVDIWKLAIQAGLDSPIIGHGANFWSAETRLRTGLTGASHAHNQFLQVFTRSGLVGLATFIWFFGLLVIYALRAAGPTRGGSLALLLAFVLRSLVEVPLQPNSVLGGEFFAFMVLLVYVIDRGAAPLALPVVSGGAGFQHAAFKRG
jgi:O-antigen ligase